MMRSSPFRRLLASVLLVTETWASVGVAAPETNMGSDVPSVEATVSTEPQEKAEAEVLKAQGDALFRERRYVEAIAAYEKSYALFADPRVLYNQGRSLQALGEHGAALRVLLAFDETAPPELRSRVEGLGGLIAAERQRVCELTVVVNVAGAEVSLDDRVLGTTPLPERLLVNAGKGKLVVRREGYFGSTRELVLPGGGVASLDIGLESKATNAKLVVRSTVAGTSVSVDGRSLGTAPSEVVLLPGAHTVLGRYEGHHDALQQVVLVAGQDRTVVLEPTEKNRPLYQEWWFWGGVGVVAAGVAAATLVWVNRPEPTDGDFSPSAISAPLIAY